MAELMQDQKEAAYKFGQWLNNTSESFAGLWADAGFGKSWVVKYIITEVVLKDSNYLPELTSMTHSAVDVLAEFTGMTVRTLHAFMGWVPTVCKETGEEGISTPRMRDKNWEAPYGSNTLLLVDEAGLLGRREFALLQQECAMTGMRVLFVGDHKQCFPVEKSDDKMCVPAYDGTDCYLSLYIPKRTDDDNAIYKLARAYRATVDGKRQPKLRTMLNSDGNTGVRHVDDIEEYCYAAFKAGVRDGDTTNIKALTFTNDRALTLNRKIRREVMGIKDLTPLLGERMVANTAITEMGGDEVIIRNNQQLIVKTIEKTDSHGLDGSFIQYTDVRGEDIAGIVFVPTSPQKLRNRMMALANDATNFREQGMNDESAAAWRTYFSLKEGCADIRFTYAMTVNKAQGVTLKHALVDLCDINKCRNYEQKCRLAYTAVSRATTYVTIEGELS